MNKNEVTLMVGSVTYATKAKRALESRGISAYVFKSTEKIKGCSYGIRFYGEHMIEAAGLLRSIGIQYTPAEASG